MGTDFLWLQLPMLLLIFSLLVWFYFYRQQRGLRVLMYHKIRPATADALTVTTTRFAQQIAHLRTAGYTPVSLSDLLTAYHQRHPLPRRAVLLTVDDAYADFVQHALPILQQQAMPVTLFVPMGCIGGQNDWDGGQEALLSVAQLQSLAYVGVSLASHSYRHENYKHLTYGQIDADLANCRATAQRLALPMQPAFAYPFGGRPRDVTVRRTMENLFLKNDIALAFRIGNRINAWPTQTPYALNRIDIRGTDSLATFRRKVRFGRIG